MRDNEASQPETATDCGDIRCHVSAAGHAAGLCAYQPETMAILSTTAGELATGDVIYDTGVGPVERYTVTGVQSLGPLVIVDFADQTASAPIPSATPVRVRRLAAAPNSQPETMPARDDQCAEHLSAMCSHPWGAEEEDMTTEEATTTSHWHVSHSDKEGVEVAGDIMGALDMARWELERDVDYHYQGISAYGEAGQYEEAYRAWERTERYSVLLANVENVTGQWFGTKDRAPLYAGDDGNELLLAAAGRLVTELDIHTPLGVWECAEAECGQTEED